MEKSRSTNLVTPPHEIDTCMAGPGRAAWEQSIVSATSTAMIACGLDGRVKFWNPQAEKLFGWAASDVIGSFDPSRPDADGGEEIKVIIAGLLIEGSHHSRNQVRRRLNSSTVAVTCTSTLLRSADGDLIGLLQEIRQSPQDPFRAFEPAGTPDLVAQLLRRSNSAVVASDLNGLIILWNDAATKTFGFTAAEMLGRPWRNRFQQLVDEKSIQQARDSETATVFEAEYQETRKDGTPIWVHSRAEVLLDNGGSPIAIAIFSCDISRRKSIELQFERERDILTEISAASPVHLILVDLAENRIAYANPAARGFYGLNERSGVRGVNDAVPLDRERMLGVVHPEDRMQLQVCKVELESNDVGFVSSIEIRMRRGDENYRWMNVRCRVLDRQPNGETHRLVATVADINDSRQKLEEAEDQARKVSETLQLARDAVPNIIYDLNLATGAVVRSSALKTLVGFSPEEVPPWRDWWIRRVHPEDRGILMNLNSDAHRETRHSVEYRVQHADGHFITVLDTGTTVCDERGERQRRVGSIMDITSLKQGEQARRSANEVLNYHLQNASLAVIVRDSELRVRSWSRHAERLFGWTAEEVHGHTLLELGFIHPQDLGNVCSLVSRLVRGDSDRIHVLCRCVSKTGNVRFIEWFCSGMRIREHGLVSVLSIGVDVTERVRAEETLRLNDDRLRRFAAAVEQVFMVLSPKLDKILYVSSPIEKVWGITFDPAAYGTTILAELLYPEDRAKLTGLCRDLLAGLRSQVEVDFPVRAQTGDDRWLHALIVANRDPEGEVVEVLALFRDISKRKRAERNQAEIDRQLQEAQRLESLGILAGGIAHDFNNILTVIQGFADLSAAEVPVNSPVSQYLLSIEEAASQAADLCQQMLAYAGKGRFIVERLDFSEVVRGTSSLLQASISKKATLRLKLDAHLPHVLGDRTQLRQILLNLVTNSSEALSDSGGQITITTGMQYLDAEALSQMILGRDAVQGDYVFLDVLDNGCGMDVVTSERAFEPFYTTKFTGRGLGLAAVQSIVRAHQGALSLTSQPGAGTRFRLLFPMIMPLTEIRTRPAHESDQMSAGVIVELDPADVEPAESDRLERTEMQPGQGSNSLPDAFAVASGLVLIADDEPLVRKLAEMALVSLGFETASAVDGRALLQLVAATDREIAAILLDLTMPNMDGEQVLDELGRIRPDIPVLLTSGYSENEIKRRFADRGLAVFLQKPFNRFDLAIKLQEVLRQRQSS